MLSAVLLASLFASPVATVLLFLPAPVEGRSWGRWPWLRRLLLALLGTAAMAALAAALLAAVGATAGNIAVSVAVLVAASLVWLPATRRWSARGHLCWAMTTLLFVAYLVFMLDWTFASRLGAAGTAGGMLLWVLELFAAFLGTAYLWELCDALGSEQWRRRIDRGAPAVMPGGELPFVSLHVPTYNEPPDMVLETLRSLTELDYERYEIVVIDDNSTDENLWRPVERWCQEHGVTFAHLDNWPGYKSGALNYALRRLMDPRTELIGVVDSDYRIDPQFLRRCAPLFGEPTVGFAQAPQDYRDWEGSPYYRRLYYSYRYFFAVSQPSRNERDGAIFAGTMGLIRRSALEEVGGWDEWCITEDAELSLRLLHRGYSGLHVDHSFGRGIMPLTFEALKGQRFRWCFGGIQILRRHWRWMLPGRQTADNRLDLGQRWAYLSGAIQWYGDLLSLVFFLFLLVGAVNIAAGGGLLFRKLTGFLVAAIPLLVLLGLVRAVALLRRSTQASWRDALGAFLIWQSTVLVVARASVQALFARQAEFLRTPKTSERARFRDAIKGNRGETIGALVGAAGIGAALTHTSGYGGPLTAGLLLWPTLAFLSAPLESLAAQRAALPPELRERRRTEFLRGRPARLTAAAGGLGFAAAAAAVVVALLAPGRHAIVPPQLVGPAQGHPADYAHGKATRSPSPSPTATPTSTTSPTTSPTPSATPSATPSSTPSSSVPTSPSPSVTPTSPTPTGSRSPTTSADAAARASPPG